jgi:hypothetical protein
LLQVLAAAARLETTLFVEQVLVALVDIELEL